MSSHLSLYLDGQFVSGEGRPEQDVFNPAAGQVIGHLSHATREHLDCALAAPARAFESDLHTKFLTQAN